MSSPSNTSRTTAGGFLNDLSCKVEKNIQQKSIKMKNAASMQYMNLQHLLQFSEICVALQPLTLQVLCNLLQTNTPCKSDTNSCQLVLN